MLPLSRRWAGNRKWCISTKDLLSHTVWLSSHRGASWRYTPPILRFYSASLYLRLNPNPRLALGGIGGGLKVGAFPQSHLPIMFATQLNGTPKYPKCLGEDHFLDKMLNSGSYCAIFPEHLYISLFGWGKNDAGLKNLPSVSHYYPFCLAQHLSYYQQVAQFEVYHNTQAVLVPRRNGEISTKSNSQQHSFIVHVFINEL